VLVLGNGDTYGRLAAGFAIGTTTAWRLCVRRSICSPRQRDCVQAILVLQAIEADRYSG
jgi:hypothetical protein